MRQATKGQGGPGDTEMKKLFLVTACVAAVANIDSVNAQTINRDPVKLDENCDPIPTGGSWNELGADAPRVLQETRRQIDACREALMLRQQKEYAARTTKPNEPLPFVLKDVISFVEPTMSCPNLDDAIAADKQTDDWLATHDCKNLDTDRQWVVINAGLSRWKQSGVVYETHGCVIDKRRYDQVKAYFHSRDTYDLGVYFGPMSEIFSKECRNVVRR